MSTLQTKKSQVVSLAPPPKTKKKEAYDSDEERRLIKEKDKQDSLNKYRLKGSRNNNNPANKLQKRQVLAIWGVKRPRDHLPLYKLDLPDPIFRVPELNKWNLRLKKTQN